MPTLVALRLVSVGHPNARFEDITLPFTDLQGAPCDSTVWLRNGGGKSSLLNLFFSLLRPDARDFLGRRAEARSRQLKDYVLPDDHALVVAEWQLDAPKDQLNFGNTARLLTGAFYERQDTGTDRPEIRKLFFCATTHEKESRLSLAGLPVFMGTDKKRRLTLSGFQQEWQTLRSQYPHLGITALTTQREWEQHLAAHGIDAELYHYQVRMNEREGGADEMFSFRDAEAFADFLLELVHDPTHSDAVRRNLSTYREQLVRRKNEYIPDRMLCQGVLEHLAPLLEVQTARTALRLDVGAHQHALNGLRAAVEAWLADAKAEVVRLEELMRVAQEAGGDAQRQAEMLKRRVAALRRHAAEVQTALRQSQYECAKANAYSAERHARAAAASIFLAKACHLEVQAQTHRDVLVRRQAQFATEHHELVASAQRFCAALAFAAHALRQQQEAQESAQRASSRDARELRDQQRDDHGRRIKASTELSGIEGWLAKADQAHDELLRQEIMISGETVPETASRLISQQETINRQQLDNQRRRIDVEQSLQVCHDEAVGHTRDQVIADEALKQFRRELGVFVQQCDEFEANTVLHALAGTTRVDIAIAAEQVRAQGRIQRDLVVKQLSGLRVQLASDERAFAYLVERSLLPPRLDVEKVVAALRTKLPGVVTGWEHITVNYPTAAARRAVVVRSPALADGVLVRDVDFQAATEFLVTMALELDGPVVVAPIASLNEVVAQRRVVVGPTTDANFDLGAGATLLTKKQASHDALQSEVQVLVARERNLTDLVAQLDQFLRVYPIGWRVSQDAHIAGTIVRLRDLQQAIGEVHQRQLRLQEERQTLDAESHELGDSRGKLAAQLVHVEHYQRTYAQGRTAQEQSRQQLRSEITLLLEACDQAASLAAEAEKTAETCGREAGRLREEARTRENERDQVEYGRPHPEPAEGPLVLLRQEYQQRRTAYEQHMGADELERLARAATQEAIEQRNALRNRLSGPYALTEQDVVEVLARMAPDAIPDEYAAQAAEISRSAAEAASTCQREHDRASEAAAHCRKICEQLGNCPVLPDEEQQMSPGEATAVADKLEMQEAELMAASAEHKRKAESARESVQQQSLRAGHLEADQKRLDTMLHSYEDLFALAQRFEPSAPLLPPREELLDQLVHHLEGQLRIARTTGQTLDTRRDAAARKLQIWGRDDRFAILKSPIAAQIAERTFDVLEQTCHALREQVELRMSVIDAQLAELDRHHATIVDEVMQVVTAGLRLLGQAARSSQLPAHVPGLGGTQFLRIRTSEPENPAEQRSRIAELVDELITTAGDIPGGIELMQRAVRRVARPIQVRVLHPDPAYGGRAVDIQDMRKFSGGEQLTSSILLYCTLAQLRARAQGIRKPSSVLILDNPIGRASRMRFLELQRDVARATGIQLVYTTGVNDLDALSTYPNVIRLRNDRVDRSQGRHVVELHPDASEGILAAARIAHAQRVPPAVPGETDAS